LADLLGLDIVRRALAEDHADDDVTARLLGEAGRVPAVMSFIVEEPCVVAGVPVIGTVYRELDASVSLAARVAEGGRADAGTTIAEVSGRADVLVSGERVALNILQRLCGIATRTRSAVDAVAGTRARITHTRKTTPGLRALEVYAVQMGGGVLNRLSLADQVLWKDNHWALASEAGRSLTEALRGVPAGMDVVVEVETEAQFAEAIAAGVKHLLVDNQTPERVADWTTRAGAGVIIQASGGITLDTARAYADAGAHLLSIGALTHSARAVSIQAKISQRSRKDHAKITQRSRKDHAKI
jgi:nicotinate-nucleotide pyrophosphorylase (carboxylating)